jgi:hypothetical protein
MMEIRRSCSPEVGWMREKGSRQEWIQQVAMAAFTDIIVVKEKAPATFGRKGQQTAVEGRKRLSPKRLVQSSFTLVDPSSQLEYRI